MSKLSHLYFSPSLPSSLGGVKRLTKRLKTRDKVKASNALRWLQGQDVYTLHKPIRNKFTRRQTIVSGIGEQLQADLIDVQKLKTQNNGMSYLLTAIDIFSKRAWVIAIKSKSGENVSKALEKIFSESKFRVVQTDKGKEFLNRHVQKLFSEINVEHFTTQNESIKASIVERFNRTFQTTMHRWFTYSGSNRYFEVLDDLVDGYNNRYHRSIGMAPNEVTFENQEEVWLKLHPPTLKKKLPKLQLGDHVRISKSRLTFKKGYTASWSSEVYKVFKVKRTNPIVYEIKDLNNEAILGTFYEQELQKVDKPTSFKIESILKRKKIAGKEKYYVKWQGYPKTFNQWIDKEDLI